MDTIQHWVPIYGSGTMLLRCVLLCFVIWFVGRAILWTTGTFFKHPSYMAISTGAAAVLIFTCLLKAVELYSFDHMVAAMVLLCFGASATFALVRYAAARAATTKVVTYRNKAHHKDISYFCVYVVLSVSLFLLLQPKWYTELQNTTIYLQLGFDLFLPKDLSTVPQYGSTFMVPAPFLSLPICAVFGLFSYDSPFYYYAFGEYWLNIIIGPTIIIGLFLTLRRIFPWWVALPLALLFCASSLGGKVASLRGESLALIVAFAFLLGVFDILEAVANRVPLRRLWMPTLILACIYAVLGLTHGVVAFATTCFAAGLAIAYLPTQRGVRDLFCGIAAASVFVATASVAYIGLPHLISNAPSSVADNSWDTGIAGAADPAVQYDIALGYLPSDTIAPPIHAAPPYADPWRFVKAAIAVPLGAMFHDGFGRFPISTFPAALFDQLKKMSHVEARFYVLLMLACLAFQLSGAGWLANVRRRAAFWGSAVGFLLIIVFAVYLDYQSRSLYPLAAIRRCFIYLQCFFVLGLASTAYNLFSILAARFANTRSYFNVSRTFLYVSRNLADAKARAEPLLRSKWLGRSFIIFGLSIGALTFLTLIKQKFGLPIIAAAAFLFNLLPGRRRIRLPLQIFPCLVITASFVFWFYLTVQPNRGHHLFQAIWARRADPLDNHFFREMSPLFDAITFIDGHTSVGDLVITNVYSENVFWFLSGGRRASLDGVSMYNLSQVIAPSAARICQFRLFLEDAELSSVSKFKFKYLLLYKNGSQPAPFIDYGDTPFPTNFSAFYSSPSFRRVYENAYYVILERTAASFAATEPDTHSIPLLSAKFPIECMSRE